MTKRKDWSADDPVLRARIAEADRQFAAGDHREAIRGFRTVLATEPISTQTRGYVQHRLGSALYNVGDTDGAVRAMFQSLRAAPRRKIVYDNLMWILIRKERSEWLLARLILIYVRDYTVGRLIPLVA